MDWQPIESAPKGVKVLGGYWNVLGKWRTITARYYHAGTLETSADYDFVEHDGYAPEGWYEESETHDDIMQCEALTHWQPLPAPPCA